MTSTQNAAFARLVDAWKRREDLRSRGADVGALVEARRELDLARFEMAVERNR